MGLARTNRRARRRDRRSGGVEERVRLRLLAEAQRRDDLPVPVEAGALQVVKETAALRDEPEQAAPRVVVLQVSLEVLRKVADALRNEGDLDLGRARVGLV